uniref:ANK_REP_REGION domain-containing protein n=1 Tax=Macrostomum lignano TaxID=282301 RepID=A0A1I8F7Y5_9PLAT
PCTFVQIELASLATSLGTAANLMRWHIRLDCTKAQARQSGLRWQAAAHSMALAVFRLARVAFDEAGGRRLIRSWICCRSRIDILVDGVPGPAAAFLSRVSGAREAALRLRRGAVQSVLVVAAAVVIVLQSEVAEAAQRADVAAQSHRQVGHSLHKSLDRVHRVLSDAAHARQAVQVADSERVVHIAADVAGGGHGAGFESGGREGAVEQPGHVTAGGPRLLEASLHSQQQTAAGRQFHHGNSEALDTATAAPLRQAADAEEDELKRREAALALRRQRLLEATEGLQRQQQRSVRSLSDVASARSDNAEHWELWQPNNLNSVEPVKCPRRLEDTWRLLKPGVAKAVSKATAAAAVAVIHLNSSSSGGLHSSAPTRVEAVSFCRENIDRKKCTKNAAVARDAACLATVHLLTVAMIEPGKRTPALLAPHEQPDAAPFSLRPAQAAAFEAPAAAAAKTRPGRRLGALVPTATSRVGCRCSRSRMSMKLNGDVEQQLDARPRVFSVEIPPPPPPLQRPQSQLTAPSQHRNRLAPASLMRRATAGSERLPMPQPSSRGRPASASCCRAARRFLTVGPARRESESAEVERRSQPCGCRCTITSRPPACRGSRTQTQQLAALTTPVSSHQQRRQATAAIARKLSRTPLSAGLPASIVLFPGPLSPSASPRTRAVTEPFAYQHPGSDQPRARRRCFAARRTSGGQLCQFLRTKNSLVSLSVERISFLR